MRKLVKRAEKRLKAFGAVFVSALFLFNGIAPAFTHAEQKKSGTSGGVKKAATVNFEELSRQEGRKAPSTRRKKKAPAYMPLPAATTPGTPENSSGPAPSGPRSGAPSPRYSANFLALEDDNTAIPPDTNGAVGPSHIMTTLNSQYRIQDRGGNTLSTVSIDSFWAAVADPDPDVFDPRVHYDAVGRRWIVVATANRENSPAPSALLFGASNSSDPRSTWNLYKIEATDGAAIAGFTAAQWVDFPSVGFNKTWIVINANIFTTSTFNKTNTWAIEKADVYGAVSPASITKFEDSSSISTIAPAITYDANQADVFLVARSLTAGNVALFRITGSDPTAPTMTTGINVPATGGAWANSPGNVNFAQQLGTAELVHVGDDRMLSVVFRNNSVWCAHTIFMPSVTPTNSLVQWWQIDVTNPAVPARTQNARIGAAPGSFFYAYPSLAVNKDNEMLIGYSRFAADQYPSANYAFRFDTDEVHTLRDDTVFKAGEGPYFKNFTGTLNRWGDYSSAIVEPGNDYVMWTLQEYAATPVGTGDDSGRWGTWWTQIIPSDLTVRLTANRSSVGVQKILLYTVAVENLGSRDFTNVNAVLTLPANTTFVSASSSNGCTQVGGDIRCPLGTVTSTSGTESTKSAIVGVQPVLTGSITATATFSSTESDRNSTNNTATLTTTVNPSTNVYPNPFRPSDSSGNFNAASGPCGNGVVFDGLVADTEIRIYTIQGDLVRDFSVSPSDNGCKAWDGKNDGGGTIASGIYMAVIKSPSGDEDVRQIAVEK